MKCSEGNGASSLSPHHSKAESDVESTATPCTQSDDVSVVTPDVGTHPAPKLLALQHTTASAPSTPAQGLARYFQGLAAGEDLAELIRSLHSSFFTCYQECMRKGEASSSVARSVAEENAGTIAPVPAPATPHRLPAGTLSASQRRAFWSATRAAFLFAAESPSAAEEATTLHCSPVTRSLLYPYGCSMSDAHASATAALPLSGVLGGGDVRMILSDVRVVELAREEVKRNPRGGWQQALHFLHQVAPTPRICAAELELLRQTNGHHWAEALRCLWSLPTAQWTEMDVGSVLRSLYYAGRRARRERPPTTRSAAPSSFLSAPMKSFEGRPLEYGSVAVDSTSSDTRTERSEVFLARLIAQALRVHCAMEEAGVLQLSTPSALNDTLGLVAQDPSAWQTACEFLDKLIAARMCKTKGKAYSTAVARSSASESHTGDLQSASPGSSTLYQLVRPNTVTIHQACRALQQRWDIGLQYVQLLRDASGGSLNLFSDITATEDVLRLCIAGQRWQEALQLVVAHDAAMRERRALSDSRKFSPSAHSRPHCVATMMSDRQHYSPHVFVQLVRLLGSVPICQPVAYALVQSHSTAAMPAGASASPSHANATSSVSSLHRTALGGSKHYNLNTLSRAYNCLLQGSATLDAADTIVKELNQHYGVDANAISPKPSTAVGTYDARLAGLETESVAHIAYLCCVAGSWQRALHHTNALLHAPRYKPTFFPTARLHDAVQYALEQAPPPGPSWELSMKLFTDMMDRNVPSSEVSFQSVVKRCFTGGAPEQAQRLFHMVLKRGVGS